MIRTLAIAFFMVTPMLFQTERERVFIDDLAKEVELFLYDLPILIDSAGILKFEDIVGSQKKFSIHPSYKPKDYCVSCTYWVKVPLLVGRNLENEWMLEFYDQTIDEITAYFPTSDGGYKMEQVGDAYDFSQKAFVHKNFEWVIDSEIIGQQNLYFKVKSHSYADIRIAIRTVNDFIGYALSEYFLYGIFYGMIFVISVYNILIFFAIREEKYLFYTFYILSVGIYAMCVDGTAFQYLWPSWPEWNQYAYGTALFSLIFWSLLFSKRFLLTRSKAPQLDKLLSAVIIIRSALFVYTLLFDHQLFEHRNIEILPLTLIFYTGIYTWQKGFKPARFFVLAYGILFLGFLLKALLYLSVIPFVTLSYYSLHVCFILEMLFLTFALSDRVRILKSNKDRALKRIIKQHQENADLKDKVNRELEEKIKERTKQIEEKNLELAEANLKLIEQKNEVNKINSNLDLDNWKLKNNVKEILQDRLINKNLSLEQFVKIFPDQATCYLFLEKLKWGNGYHCAKCNNNKYLEGRVKFHRRCSKCGYTASVTSNTIFHGIKFPIEKAFFILYVTNNRQNKYTLDQLSEMIDLRRNTVWNFKKKIEKVYDADKGSSSTVLVHNLFSSHLS